MGSICPCLRRKISAQRQGPYDAHETFEIEEHIGALPTGTHQNFQAFAEEPPATSSAVTKQTASKVFNTSHSKDSSEENNHVSEENEHPEREAELQHKTSTKSLIRKRLHESVGNHSDESLQNLERGRKIITILYNPSRQVTIKSCKKTSIFIFDTSSSITIEKCSECTIFCAPCSGKISITNCKQMKLLLISAQMEIRRSKECDISLFCASPPQISSSSELCFSNFMRVGYSDLTEQFVDSGLEVWNNRFLDVEDHDQDPDEEHYSQKKLNVVEIEWGKLLSQARVQEADPVIPLFWGDMKLNKKKQIYVMNQPIRQIESKLLKYIISNNITLHKAYKGILSTRAFSKMKQLFPLHQENKYLCLVIGKELEASGFEAYFERILGKDVDGIERDIFPEIEKPE